MMNLKKLILKLTLKKTIHQLYLFLFILNEYCNRKTLYYRVKSIGIFPDNIQLCIAIVKIRMNMFFAGV